MKFIQIHPTSRDCTTLYDVELSRPYTIKEFVDEVLSARPDEWGCFHILRNGDTLFSTTAKCEYRYGKMLNQIPDTFLSRQILKVKAIGGYSAMDYYIRIKETEK